MEEIADRRPIYRRLRDQLAAEIARDVWKAGDPIASESELVARYRVSVGTVRKAVDLLVNDGLIDRVHGSGMFVRRPDFGHAFVRFTQLFGSAGDRRVPDSRILQRDVLAGPPEVTTELNLRDGAQLVRLLRLRNYEGKPAMHEEIWLEAARFAAMLTVPDDVQLLYPLYENLCGEIVARAEETITVDVADIRDRELLALEEGAHIVRIARRALAYDDRPVEWRCSRSAALNFYYKIEIR